MFGRLMNSYYYGKSGKGDFRKEDMPENRWQLFWDVLRTRLSGICRLNLMYMLCWLPAMILLLTVTMNSLSNLSTIMAAQDGTLKQALEESAGEENALTYTDEQIAQIAGIDARSYLESTLMRTLLMLIPCILITGPFTAGVSYVLRNWARDEHAFIWSDFKDAVKENWKQGLAVSAITAVLPALLFVAWRFYGQMAVTQPIMLLPQMLVLMIAVIWAFSVTYFYPLMVTYELKLRDVLRNGLLMSVARLPMSVGIRLLHCVPVLIGAALCYLWHPIYGALILTAYYMLIGFGLSRFITASYTNAVFDRFLNPRIEGARVNQGLRNPEEDEEEEYPEDNPEEINEENSPEKTEE